ncbi:family 16 glycosylhydrolase [Dyadobacter sp. CY323]|uniref:glycoside hydrolase family 16 protein n=1 Tax=Dyadobacter sp. CY323 TaxID=2907302 RepID=UPI001F4228DC|nr:glycoside hydrolase family 16 protein [Dyadobacter sp. CY323]MCE6990897.1 glycoside hydrolase family 16 protein [Dyadobacter sp. CY323]
MKSKMPLNFKTLILSVLLMTCVSPLYAQWKLVWSDEFDTDGPPNPANWTFEKGFTRNHEAQWFQEQNAFCKNGYLIIEARKEKVTNPKYVADSKNWKENREYAEYTSASLITRGKQSWQYGRWEMKARIDTQAGLWPAFWTLGTEGEWPDNGEIDIMEFYRGTLLANIAWGSTEQYKPVWNSVKTPLSQFKDPEWSKKFHIWRMDWDENAIELFVDDVLLASQKVDKEMNLKNKAVAPFNQPHYMLLTLAVGGENGGDPSKSDFPARFEIDYVKVFQAE